MGRHLGSTIAMVFGVLMTISGLVAVNGKPNILDMTTGVSLILGGIAYRSAKQRHLGNASANAARIVFFEILPVLGISYFLFGQNDFKNGLAHEPVQELIMVLAGIPYLLMAFRSSEAKSSPTSASER